MPGANHSRRFWLLPAGCIGLIVCLSYGSLQKSGFIYAGARRAEAADSDRKPIVLDRAPARVIKDPYPSISAVAVNPEDNMLVVTDENLYQVLVSDDQHVVFGIHCDCTDRRIRILDHARRCTVEHNRFSVGISSLRSPGPCIDESGLLQTSVAEAYNQTDATDRKQPEPPAVISSRHH